MHSGLNPIVFVIQWLLMGVSLLALLAYLYGAHRQTARGRPWNPWRTVSFLVGISLVILAFHPPSWGHAYPDMRSHMLQHLLLGMFAPLGLILAAPFSLLLRNVPTNLGRWLVGVFRSGFLNRLTGTVPALLLNLGGLYLVYLTPLYALSSSNEWLHLWLQLHFLFAGCLFTWVVAGPDPGPARPSANRRLFVLFLSMAGHALLAKMIYAYGLPSGSVHSQAEIEAAAKLMYYGGDLAEVLLLIALLCGSERGVKWRFSKLPVP